MLIVPSTRAREVHKALANAEGVSSSVLVGDGVHLVVDDAPRRIAQFRKQLEAASIPFDSIGASEPSIEDLFVAYVQAQH